jgi:hypothetical protein
MPEYRFDFAFPGFSEEAPVAAVTDSVLLEVPDNAAEVLKLFAERTRLIDDLVKRGAFGEVWVPALQAKDLALALDVRIRELPIGRRASATTSIDRLVKAAWQLDEYGDIGNRAQVEQANAALSSAAADIVATFSPIAAREGRR